MSKWEKFAREDAEFFILTNVEDARAEGESREEAFFRTGREAAAGILRHVDSRLPRREAAAEIGCGVGRIALAMAEYFDEVRGVDVSQSMLERLEANAAAMDHPNVRGYRPDQAWDEPASLDLAYSWLVFQHIADGSIIADYLCRIGRALRDDGVACLQFDTRPATFTYRVRNRLPGFLLPRTQRRGIQRIRRSREWVLARAAEAGLALATEFEPGTEVHGFVFRPSRR